MAVNDRIVQTETGLADSSDFVIDGSNLGTGAGVITELGGGGGADIYREVDVDGDGNFEVSEKIDARSGTWHSKKNRLTISDANNARLKITNTHGSSKDFYALGYEVDD